MKATIWEQIAVATPINRMAARGATQRKEVIMGRSTVLHRIEEEAALYGFHKARDTANGIFKTGWQIRCSNCQRDYRANWGPDTSPSLMVKNMRVRKWDVARGERPLCPDCQHPHKAAPMPKPEQPVAEHCTPWPNTALARAFVQAAAVEIVKRAPQAQEEEPKMNVAPKIAREVFTGLDAYFDAKSRLYSNGYDDARVAKECGTTADVVAYLRREAFGELAADPRLDAIRKDTAALKIDIATALRVLEGRLRDMESRLDQATASARK